MAERVVLHVGLMKSGTTYLQQRLMASYDVLRAQGVLFPGKRWKNQVLAVVDVLGLDRVPEGFKPGAWQRLVDEVAEWPGLAVISMEFLAVAKPREIRRVVRSFKDTKVEVIVTARDLGRTVPAMWQEEIKNAYAMTFDEFVASIRHPRSRDGLRFWRTHGLDGAVKRWSRAVGRRNLTVVTVPPPGGDRELLWRRFCEATGIPVDAYVESGKANESLGAASTEVMRRVNVALQARQLPWGDYDRVVKRLFGQNVLGPHRPEEEGIGVTVPGWLRRRAERMVQLVAKRDVRVIGDLDELTPRDVRGVDPSSVSAEQALDASVAAIVALLEREIERGHEGPKKGRGHSDSGQTV